MVEYKKRQTAYKVSIGLLFSAMDQGLNFEQDRFKFLSFQDKSLYRINLIASVIDKFESAEKPYINVTLDDGTGNIRVKAFADDVDMLRNLQLGDIILVVGVLRYYNEELYIMPEIIKALEPKWLVARKLELEKEYGKTYNKGEYEYNGSSQIPYKEIEKNQKQDLNVISQETPEKIEIEKIEKPEEKSSNVLIGVREKILELIRNSEGEGGLDIDKLIMALKEPVEQINKEITVLLEDGTIYEPKPGRLRVL
jgi:RPA family protein